MIWSELALLIEIMNLVFGGKQKINSWTIHLSEYEPRIRNRLVINFELQKMEDGPRIILLYIFTKQTNFFF